MDEARRLLIDAETALFAHEVVHSVRVNLPLLHLLVPRHCLRVLRVQVIVRHKHRVGSCLNSVQSELTELDGTALEAKQGSVVGRHIRVVVFEDCGLHCETPCEGAPLKTAQVHSVRDCSLGENYNWRVF